MIEAELAPWRAQLDRLTRTVVGAAGQLLLISRSHEARLGNLYCIVLYYIYCTVGEARQPRGRGHARLLGGENHAGRVHSQVRLQQGDYDGRGQQTASLMLTAIMSGGVGISGRELYKYR